MATKDAVMQKIIKLSEKSGKNGEVPVGAALVCGDKIISVGYNTREKQTNVLGHAEINCIVKANKRLERWNLSDCDMYVTLKPCSMCESIIRQARIRRVYYLIDKNVKKKEFNKTIFKICNDDNYSTKYKTILSAFFKNLR